MSLKFYSYKQFHCFNMASHTSWYSLHCTMSVYRGKIMNFRHEYNFNREKFLNRWHKTQFRIHQNNYGKAIIQNHRRHPQSEEYQDVPTFEEFVEYLIATPVWKYNHHWIPYYMKCTLCHQRFTINMHLDSILVDGRYLACATGLDELFPRHTHGTINTTQFHFHPGRQTGKVALSDLQIQFLEQGIQTSGTKITTELSFFSEITMQQLMKLYSVYKTDFDMFNYNISPYDHYVKSQ